MQPRGSHDYVSTLRSEPTTIRDAFTKSGVVATQLRFEAEQAVAARAAATVAASTRSAGENRDSRQTGPARR